MTRLILLSVCFALAGCSALIIRDDDTGAQKAGKVAVRSAYCILTLPTVCASEWSVMKDIKDDEALFVRYEPQAPLTETGEVQP